MAPSLEPYKGCTIIDVHPGACLWSSKLHEYLKPKRHVLMEPEQRYYKPFIKPLLEKPGSTYRHTELTGAHPREYWNNYKTIMNDPDLASQPTLERDDPKLRELDTNLLLIGNMCRRYEIQAIAGHVDYAPLIMQHMTYAAQLNETIHGNSLVRMLWWVPEASKPLALPGLTRFNRSFSVGLALGANVTEVAGTERLENRPSGRNQSRPSLLDRIVAEQVRSSMAENGTKIPPGREMPFSNEAAGDSSPYREMMATTCTSIADLEEAIEDFQTHASTLKDILARTRSKSRESKAEFRGAAGDRFLATHIRYPQCIASVREKKVVAFHCGTSTLTRAMLVMDLYARLINLEANYAAVAEANPDSPPQLSTLRAEVLACGTSTDELVEEYTGQSSQYYIQMILEDYVSCAAQPPTLNRDRRSYEPLLIKPDEFWPNYNLTLLDFTPHSEDLSVPDVASQLDGVKVCQRMLRNMFLMSAHPLPAALDRLAPNAAQDLIPQVPELADPRRGGRLDPKNLSVRMLTPEMWRKLVKAFFEWPFRPSRLELALSEANMASGQDEEDGNVHESGFE